MFTAYKKNASAFSGVTVTCICGSKSWVRWSLYLRGLGYIPFWVKWLLFLHCVAGPERELPRKPLLAGLVVPPVSALWAKRPGLCPQELSAAAVLAHVTMDTGEVQQTGFAVTQVMWWESGTVQDSILREAIENSSSLDSMQNGTTLWQIVVFTSMTGLCLWFMERNFHFLDLNMYPKQCARLKTSTCSASESGLSSQVYFSSPDKT